MRRFILVAMAMAPTLASAAVMPRYGSATTNDTTTCNRIGNSVICNSSGSVTPQPSPMEAFDEGYARGAAIRAAQTQALQSRQAQQDADQRDIVVSRVANMIAENDCDGAKRLALAAGDLDLAERAMRLCTPKAP